MSKVNVNNSAFNLNYGRQEKTDYSDHSMEYSVDWFTTIFYSLRNNKNHFFFFFSFLSSTSNIKVQIDRNRFLFCSLWNLCCFRRSFDRYKFVSVVSPISLKKFLLFCNIWPHTQKRTLEKKYITIFVLFLFFTNQMLFFNNFLVPGQTRGVIYLNKKKTN